MRQRPYLLAATVLFCLALPARATVVLEWHMSPNQASTAYTTQPNPDVGPGGSNEFGDYPVRAVVGPQVSGTMFVTPGQTFILQAVIHQTDNIGPNVITYNGPGTQGTNSGGGLIGWGIRVNNSNPAFATHGQPSNNNANTHGVDIYGFNGNGNQIVTQGFGPAGSTAAFTTVRDLTLQDWYNSDGYYPLFNMRITVSATAFSGLTTLSFADPSGGADNGTFTRPNMDAALFSNTPTFTLSAIPEPSSMALAGLGVSGMAWRMLRRRRMIPSNLG